MGSLEKTIYVGIPLWVPVGTCGVRLGRWEGPGLEAAVSDNYLLQHGRGVNHGKACPKVWCLLKFEGI